MAFIIPIAFFCATKADKAGLFLPRYGAIISKTSIFGMFYFTADDDPDLLLKAIERKELLFAMLTGRKRPWLGKPYNIIQLTAFE